MLTLTENAVAVIRSLTTEPQVPDGAGLRIATDDGQPDTLTLTLSPTPQDGDQVLDAAGARLFLDDNASVVLDDKALDAEVDPQGVVSFQVMPQAGDLPGGAAGSDQTT